MPDLSTTAVNTAGTEAKASEVDNKAPIKIGIIYPPPEVRNIVDKTADFVARNGPEFEARIRQNEINNPKFNFLNGSDPYHAYYQHKVREFKEGRAQETTALKTTTPSAARAPMDGSAVTASSGSKLLMQQEFVPKDPPPDPEFISDPPSIKALDLDIVKLTAQFVARNGRQFLTQVMNREQRNFQFDFLRPQHSLFNYFTKLVEQYTKILIPPKDLVGKMTKEAEDWTEVYSQVKYRVDWLKWLERQKKREEEAAERERVSYAQIDWHDFVVVETVDYQPHEVGNFPPPTTPEEVGARVLAEERGVPNLAKKIHEIDLDLEEGDEAAEAEAAERAAKDGNLPTGEEDMEQSSDEELEDDDDGVDLDKKDDDDEEEEEEVVSREQGTSTSKADAPPPPPPPPPVSGVERVLPPPPPPNIPGAAFLRPTVPPRADQVLIRRDYDPKVRPEIVNPAITKPGPSSGGTEEALLVSPFTGEKIPASEVQKHMRIGLLDPKWMEQRDREMRERQEQEQVYAPGVGIQDNLKKLAERRTDIFGIGVDETAIGKKLGEEISTEETATAGKQEKLIWDGHSGSMDKVVKRARESITVADQLKHINQMKSILKEDEREKIGPQKTFSAPAVKATAAPPPPPPLPRTIESEAPSKPPPPPISISQPEPLRSAAIVAPLQTRIAVAPPQPLQPPPPPQQPPMLMMQRQPIMAPQVTPVLAPSAPVMAPTFMNMSTVIGTTQTVPGMAPPAPPGESYEPPSKKMRSEDSLVPEDVFLRSHKGPSTFKVFVPNMPDKSEWRLIGQVLTFSMSLSEPVSTLKQRLFEECSIPIGKQKLQMDGLFLKDTNSLAFYNILNGSVIQLLPKERGGRKK